MRIEITFEEASKEFPKTVEAIMVTLRQGKSKNRLAAAADLTWFIDMATVGKCYTAKEVFSGKAKTDQRFFSTEPKTILEARLENTVCGLEGNIGRFSGYEKLDVVPARILAILQKDAEKEAAEQRRLTTLTPEERAGEANEILKLLCRDPGFAAFSMPVKK